MAFGKTLGDFWKDRKRDLSALPELVKQLEAKLLPVPSTGVLKSKTALTVWEWMIDGKDRKNGLPVVRGGGHLAYGDFTCVSARFGGPSAEKFAQSGIRLVRKSRP
jgi:hypothetical protein